MPGRATSPAPSEGDVDIFGSLYPGDDEDSTNRPNGSAGMDLDLGGILDAPEGEEDDEAFIALQQAASFRKASNLKGKTLKKGGGFQAMGLNANLLRAITRKGFSVPTPIQRKAIPLILSRRDVVAMARTGSGKTAAFVIPLVERLRNHSARVGSRAIILSPSRELALQTLKVVKELGRGGDLRTVLLVGGDSLDEQFAAMASNPDIILATPGRLLHLKVEMGLNLSTVEYVVFDEADRLFEMGFATQLTEILHALPMARQTLLFSATLPGSLVEFARAGLREPSLVRLDAETKISPDLQSAFFTVKGQEKEGALLYVLQDVIKMPLGAPPAAPEDETSNSRKRKRGPEGGGRGRPTEHSTIVFAATKLQVEFLSTLLIEVGYAVSYVYGTLDQVARRNQVEAFRTGQTNILVVTDVAARGIDLPLLANVINFDFPAQPKLYVHRVGRTARAGQRGWSYSLVRDVDAPYLIDLQLFLGRKLVIGKDKGSHSFAEDVVVGGLPRYPLESCVEWVANTLDANEDLVDIRRVAAKAQNLYMKTRTSASAESAKRARECVAAKSWSQTHHLFGEQNDDMEQAREEMLAKISGYKPLETIFEIRAKKGLGSKHAAEIAQQLRKRFSGKMRRKSERGEDQDMREDEPTHEKEDDEGQGGEEGDDDGVGMDDDDVEVTVSNNSRTGEHGSFRDAEVYMSYTPRTSNIHEERGYGVQSGNISNFTQEARAAAMNLTNDEGAKNFGEPTRAKMRWDKKNSKYVSTANDNDGSKGSKMIKGESGVKIAASYKSGRFDKWMKAQRLNRLPRVGELEKGRAPGSGPGGATSGPRYKHKQELAPKEADKYRDDYHVRKKRVAEAREKRVGRFKDGMGSRKEIKGIEDVRRARKEMERKKQKNARPSRKKT